MLSKIIINKLISDINTSTKNVDEMAEGVVVALDQRVMSAYLSLMGKVCIKASAVLSEEAERYSELERLRVENAELKAQLRR